MTVETVKVDYLNARDGDKPPSIRANGKYYGVSDDDFDSFEKGKSYSVNVISREGKGKWAGRTFYDITSIVGAASGSAASGTGPAVAANGHAAPSDSERERNILRAVLIKTVQPRPYATRQIMADEMYTIWLAANDACDRILL